MMSKGGNVIQVANVDLLVTNGIFVQRNAPSFPASAAGRHLLGSSATAGTEHALRVSAFTGVQQPLTSAMDIEDLIELNYLHVSS